MKIFLEGKEKYFSKILNYSLEDAKNNIIKNINYDEKTIGATQNYKSTLQMEKDEIIKNTKYYSLRLYQTDNFIRNFIRMELPDHILSTTQYFQP